MTGTSMTQIQEPSYFSWLVHALVGYATQQKSLDYWGKAHGIDMIKPETKDGSLNYDTCADPAKYFPPAVGCSPCAVPRSRRGGGWRVWKSPSLPPPGPSSCIRLWTPPTFAAGASLIQWESALAFAGEAPRSVLANTLRPTQVDVGSAFVVI